MLLRQIESALLHFNLLDLLVQRLFTHRIGALDYLDGSPTNAGQPISWDNSITQIRCGCNIHQLFQLVNVLLALNTAGVGAPSP